MQEEMNSLHDNHTYNLIKLQVCKKALQNKWMFCLMHKENCSHPRYKAQLIVKGFGHKKGVDFNEIFSLVVNVIYLDSVGYGRSMDLEVEQLDVKIAFLHGDL